MRGGIGINEEDASPLRQDIGAEVDNTFGFNLRLQVDLQNDFYLFLQPPTLAPSSSSRLPASTARPRNGFRRRGFDFILNPNFGLEAGYERLDGGIVWRGAVRSDV